MEAMTRRKVLQLGSLAVTGIAVAPHAAGAHSRTSPGSLTNEVVRRWYKAWEQRDWGPIDAMLADDFTFTSAAGDDHISKSTFRSNCWETQRNFIDHFDIEQLFTQGNEAMVKYLCHTVNGKSFRNVEYLQIRAGRVRVIECYFGERSSFPSAVSNGGS
jgi:ketosteroid isomerase-like protein